MIASLIGLTSYCVARVSSKETIHQFMHWAVPPHDRHSFCNFYKDFNKKHHTLSRLKQSKGAHSLYSLGKQNLAIKHPERFAALRKEDERATCIRFGCYEKFCQQAVSKSQQLWHRMTYYVKDIGVTISQTALSLKRTIFG